MPVQLWPTCTVSESIPNGKEAKELNAGNVIPQCVKPENQTECTMQFVQIYIV